MNAQYKYRAYIAYSHEDEAWASWLHRAIERYRVPRKLVGRTTLIGVVPKRLDPVFRDRDELPTAASLTAELREALRQSLWLIVICSPRSAESRWVHQEIETFRKGGRADRVLCLIVDGEPNAGDRADPKVKEALPRALRREAGKRGTLLSDCGDPLAADVREGRGTRREALLKLLAGMLGVGYDELRRRNRQRRIRRGAALCVAALLLVASGSWLMQRAVLQEERAESARLASILERGLRARDLASSRGAATQALRVGVEAVADELAFGWESNQEVYVGVLSALDAMQRSLPLTHRTGEVTSAEFSPDGRFVLTAGMDGTARIWSASDGRPLTTIEYGSPVWDAALSPSGELVVTAGQAHTPRVWRTDGRPVSSLSGHTDHVESVAFSSDSAAIVTAGRDGTARIWSAHDGKELATLIPRAVLVGLGHRVRDAAFSADGRLVVTACQDGAADVWHREDGSRASTLEGHTDAVWHAEFSPGGGRVVTASDDGTARIWRVLTGEPLVRLEGHVGEVLYASFDRSGEYVVTAGADGTARVWRSATGQQISPALAHGASVLQAVLSRDGYQILTSSKDGVARLWNRNGELIETLDGHPGGVCGASFSPDESRIVTAGRDGVARIWPGERAFLPTELRGHREEAWWASFSRDGTRVLTESNDDTARLWDAVTGELLSTLSHGGDVLSAAFSPDGRLVATASLETGARLWRCVDGSRIRDLGSGEDSAYHVEFSPDGRHVVVATVREQVTIHDGATGEVVVALDGHEGGARKARFSPDGSLVATVSRGSDSEAKTARVWRSSGEHLRTLPRGRNLREVGFSPDGTRLLLVLREPSRFTQMAGRTVEIEGTGFVEVWDLESGALEFRVPGHSSKIRHAEFSPDGKTILTVGEDGSAKVWDAADGERLVRVEHEPAIYHGEFSPGGGLFVTAGVDYEVRLWIAEEGSLLTTLGGHEHHVTHAAFSSDGRRLATVSRDGTGRVYDISRERLLERGCTLLRHQPEYLVVRGLCGHAL